MAPCVKRLLVTAAHKGNKNFIKSQDFLMDDTPLRQLAPLEKTCAELYCFLTSLGIEKEDLPMFSDLLRKRKHHQHREQSEAVYEGSDESSDQEQEMQDDTTTHPSPEHSHPRTFVPALKSFLKQITKPMEKSSKQSLRFPQIEARDTLGDEAYWDSMGNIISEDRLKLWATAEKALNHYHAILVETSELASKTQSLEEENKALRMGLQLKGIIPSQM